MPPHENAAPAPHVVIVGGGFGGLYAAKRLKHRAVRVTVVDRRNYHLFPRRRSGPPRDPVGAAGSGESPRQKEIH